MEGRQGPGVTPVTLAVPLFRISPLPWHHFQDGLDGPLSWGHPRDIMPPRGARKQLAKGGSGRGCYQNHMTHRIQDIKEIDLAPTP